MICCEKCGGNVASNNKCIACGFDNSNVRTPENVGLKGNGYLRSTRLKVFVFFCVALNAIMLLIFLFGLSSYTYDLKPINIIIMIINLILLVAQTALFVFIYQLKKWAVTAYLVLFAATSALDLIRNPSLATIIVILITSLIIYFFLNKDWDLFE